jgi:hypothetical protein
MRTARDGATMRSKGRFERRCLVKLPATEVRLAKIEKLPEQIAERLEPRRG